MGARKPSALKGLKGRLIELAKKADSYEEVKLNLILEGWNLDDGKVKGAVKRWLTQSLSHYANNSYFVRILELYDDVSEEQVAARCEVMKGLWEDVVDVEDKDAARVGMLLVAHSMTWCWNAAEAAEGNAEDGALKAIGKLVTWLGQLAW